MDSFTHIHNWLTEIRTSAPEDTEIIVFGNKSDLDAEIQVSDHDIKEFTAKTGIQIIKCSAKSASNVEKGFIQLTSKLIEK